MAFYRVNRAPTVTDDVDSSYLPGDVWVNTTNGKVYRCIANTKGRAVWTGGIALQGVRAVGPIIMQAELAVGATTVRLFDTTAVPSLPCSRIWFGAPTSVHTKAGTNTGAVLIGSAVPPADNTGGGIPLANSNALGFFYPVSDAADVSVTGFSAGDRVEFQIFGA